MSNVQITILATLALCSGPVIFFRSFRDFTVRRLIQNTPTAHIRSMAMGLVEVNGTVAPRSVVNAPFSGRPCVFWDIDIATMRRRAEWTIVHRNQSGHPFHLDDETGRALVYPRGARCTVRHGTEEKCVGIALPDCYSHYMSEQRLALRHFWRLGAMRFRERILEEGQRVYVLGSAEPCAQAYTISAGDEELQATGTDGPAPRAARPREAVAVIRRGRHESTFIISQETERELLMGLGFHFVLKLIAGPLLTAFGLWVWIEGLATQQIFR
jgi:hypothetical protein